MKRFVVIFSLCFGSLGFAQKAQAGKPPSAKLIEVFLVAQNPGSGTLVHTKGGVKESIAFTPESGHYGLGMIFKPGLLPNAFQKDFKNREIIQIAFGTLKSKGEGKIPQFAAATLLTGSFPKKRTKFPLVVPSGKEDVGKDLGLLLFSSPATPSEQSDEEKLKGTLFAQGGSLSVNPKGKPTPVTIQARGQQYGFKWQPVSFQFEAVLVTPFSPDESKLTGEVTVPVYWPATPEAEKFAREIAEESMGPLGPVSETRSVTGAPEPQTKAPGSR